MGLSGEGPLDGLARGERSKACDRQGLAVHHEGRLQRCRIHADRVTPIVVAIIGIIAAIAVPGLLRARMAGSEASAMGSVCAVNGAQAIYAATCGGGFYSHIPRPTSRRPRRLPAREGLSRALTWVTIASLKSGYSVALTAGPAAAGASGLAVTVRRLDSVVSTYFVGASPIAGAGGRFFGFEPGGHNLPIARRRWL